MYSPLTTERLTLDMPTLDDVDAMTAACQDDEIRKWTPLPQPYQAEHAEQFVADVERRTAAGEGYDWAVRLDGAFIGMVGVMLRGPGTGEIGYWASPQARGNGYLTEATRAVVDFSFEPLGIGLALERLEWNAVVGNIASARLARTLGFRYEGVRRGALTLRGSRQDAWSAARLYTDAPKPIRWTVLKSVLA